MKIYAYSASESEANGENTAHRFENSNFDIENVPEKKTVAVLANCMCCIGISVYLALMLLILYGLLLIV